MFVFVLISFNLSAFTATTFPYQDMTSMVVRSCSYEQDRVFLVRQILKRSSW